MPTGGTSTTSTEWGKSYVILNSAATFGSCAQGNVYGRILCTLKLPLSGGRAWNDGSFGNQGSFGFYWSSSSYASNSDIYFAQLNIGSGNMAQDNPQSQGFSLRCLRN